MGISRGTKGMGMGSQPVEFDEFAACLRALRERAGLSYGALARRTGISSSSLHRYCSGSYVPQDYGAAHRFATACGASPEELRRLHRLWALADAAREGEATGQEEGDPESAPPVPTAPATPTAPPTPDAPPSSPPRRRQLALGLSVLALVVVLGGTVWAMDTDANSESAVASGPELVRADGNRSAGPAQDASSAPDSRADDCPAPGQRFKTPTHQRVYLVGPGGNLYYIPNATIYFNLWDTWDAVTIVNGSVFADCDWPTAHELADAFLTRTSSSAQVYIWDAWSGYRRITGGTAFNRYGFSWSKIQTRSAPSPVSSHDWP